jgi:hypothetical protein
MHAKTHITILNGKKLSFMLTYGYNSYKNMIAHWTIEITHLMFS